MKTNKQKKEKKVVIAQIDKELWKQVRDNGFSVTELIKKALVDALNTCPTCGHKKENQ